MVQPDKTSPPQSFAILLGLLLVVGASLTVSGQTNYQRLKSFDGPSGRGPTSGLIEGSDGLLYGTTVSGGSNSTRGTVFRMAKDGTAFQVLRHFASGAEGNGPVGGVLEGTDGRLYGTTRGGGSNITGGTVFKLNKDGGGYTVLWRFSGTEVDGRMPQTGLIQGSDGFLYGTTYGSPGSVFRIAKDGTGFLQLHRFAEMDGTFPWGNLVEASDGALYGTTYSGTTPPGPQLIFGTIFKVNKDGSNYSIVHVFDYYDWANGSYPYGGLIQASDGKLYGTTAGGGSAGNYGTVFRMNVGGSGYQVIYAFTGDGSEPRGNLLEGANGALYGVNYNGGIGTNGTAFRLNNDGSGYTVLRRFANGVGDGKKPYGYLLSGSDGAIYGTTFSGGETNSGTVFKLFSVTPRPALSLLSKSATGTLLELSGGAAGATYGIDASTNLGLTNGWNALGSNAANIEGRFQFFDASSTNSLMRFYRGVIP